MLVVRMWCWLRHWRSCSSRQKNTPSLTNIGDFSLIHNFILITVILKCYRKIYMLIIAFFVIVFFKNVIKTPFVYFKKIKKKEKNSCRVVEK
jgi:hypothetical protein